MESQTLDREKVKVSDFNLNPNPKPLSPDWNVWANYFERQAKDSQKRKAKTS